MRATNFLIFLISVFSANADPFQNLGFDDANTNNMEAVDPAWGEGWGATADLLPGWNLLWGSKEEDSIGFNYSIPGLGYASLYNSNNPNWRHVEGQYALELYPDNYRNMPYSLTQIGDVPGEAKSITLTLLGGPVVVYMNDSLVPLIFNPDFNDYPPYPDRIISVTGDVSPFSGQTVELKIVTAEGGIVPWRSLDSIAFSPLAIPEPTGSALFFVGLLLFGLSCVYRNKGP
ncbi:MAG: hypothetical protein M1608_12020 [Candidatus Omnitrophica bacterium]|nr:hypothetical protein [Candidatus Omnitrophota bacterium]